MGIFSEKYLRSLHEITIGGEDIQDDEDDFTVEDTPEDDGEDTPDTPEGEAQNAEGETPAATNTDAEAGEAAADAPENANDAAGDEGDDEFQLPDDAGDDPDTGGDNADTPDTNTDDNAGEDTGDDEFNMGDGGDDPDAGGDTEGGEGGDTEGGGTGDETDGDTATDTTTGDTGTGDELQQKENELYDTLSEEQKKIRILQLKINFKTMYEQVDSIMDSLVDIPKTDDNIEVIRRLIVVLNNIKRYIIDYMDYEFDKRTYLDNNQIYIKYINLFRTIQKVISELTKEQTN